MLYVAFIFGTYRACIYVLGTSMNTETTDSPNLAHKNIIMAGLVNQLFDFYGPGLVNPIFVRLIYRAGLVNLLFVWS
jgi:hypothetical protein